MKRTFTMLIAFISIHSSGFAQLSLEECQQLARENYPMIKRLDLIEKSKEMNLSNAVKAYLPQLSITGMASLIDGMPEISMPGATSESNNHQFIGIANLTQTIWDGGVTRSQRKITSASAEVEKQNIEVLLYDINERINQLYFGVLMIDEQLKQLSILDDNLSRSLKRAETARAGGVAYRSDLDAIKVEILNSEQTRINLNAQRQAYIQMLSVMIKKDIPNYTTLSIPAEIPITNNNINRPELRLYEQQRLLSDLQNTAITARYLPKVGLTGYAIGLTPGIKSGIDKTDHLLIAGISLSWNIGGFYTKKNDRNIIRTNMLKIDNQQEIFLFNTGLELTQANNQIDRSRQLMLKDDEIVQLRESIKRSSEIKYENGACTMSDLLNDISAESMARQNKALHEMEYLMYLYSHKTISGN
ncbi:MAG: TolC family protein [Prevotellaceae bacterium]|nr:TolC family protein [Prevotellaceae bacterium]